MLTMLDFPPMAVRPSGTFLSPGVGTMNYSSMLAVFASAMLTSAFAVPPQEVETAAPADTTSLDRAMETIAEGDLRGHLQFLSHDLLEGRAPGTRGGRLASVYIGSRFSAQGLEAPGGSHFQSVPVVASTVDTSRTALRFLAGEQARSAEYPAEAVIWPGVQDTLVEAEAELVFVGYGIDAPEFDWNDFGTDDLQDKILLVLVNDPPAPPDEPQLFDGPAMTYYGRWTYKFEEAARRGAAGALIVHTTDAAGYPWEVVETSWTGEQFALPSSGAEPALQVEGWVTQEFARTILNDAELSLDELFVQAARRDFQPVHTGITVEARVAASTRRLDARNVIGLLPGTHPERRNEVVVYTSHYDHLGIGPPVDGDSIYNGAYDNASGVALLLEIAEAFAALDPGPERSILFIATDAEEAGLLGAEHYVRDPLFPLRRTVANINVDGANLWGETDDVVALGSERSTLGGVIEARAAQLDMHLSRDRAPEKGFFFRSDHFPFARSGVPALYIEHGSSYRDRPEGWGAERLERYDARSYHRPSDQYDPSFDLAGAVQQARLALLVGYDVAQQAEYPEWHEGTEFRTARERMMSGAANGR